MEIFVGIGVVILILVVIVLASSGAGMAAVFVFPVGVIVLALLWVFVSMMPPFVWIILGVCTVFGIGIFLLQEWPGFKAKLDKNRATDEKNGGNAGTNATVASSADGQARVVKEQLYPKLKAAIAGWRNHKWMLYAVAGVIAVLVMANIFIPPMVRNARYREAEQWLADGKFTGAINAFTDLGDSAKADEARLQHSEVLLRAQQHAAAARIIAVIGGRRPDSKVSEAVWKLGAALYDEGKLEAALVVFESFKWSTSMRGELAGKSTSASNALRDMRNALKVNEAAEAARAEADEAYARGERLLANRIYDAAVEAFEEAHRMALAATPANGAAANNGGAQAAPTLRSERAKAVRYQQGEASLEAGDFSGALTAFTAASDFGDATEHVIEILNRQSAALLASGEFAGAIEALIAAGDESKAQEITYRESVGLVAARKYNEALELLHYLEEDYMDSAQYRGFAETMISSANPLVRGSGFYSAGIADLPIVAQELEKSEYASLHALIEAEGLYFARREGDNSQQFSLWVSIEQDGTILVNGRSYAASGAATDEAAARMWERTERGYSAQSTPVYDETRNSYRISAARGGSANLGTIHFRITDGGLTIIEYSATYGQDRIPVHTVLRKIGQ